MDKKIIVKVHSKKYFNNKQKAREFIIKLMEAGLTFLEVHEEEK